MFIQALHLKDFLSFQDVSIELGPVNMLIGANGSGKSNVIEAIDFLRHCPDDLSSFVLNNGGTDEWIRRANSAEVASIKAYCRQDKDTMSYSLSFRPDIRFPLITHESLDREFAEGPFGEFQRSVGHFEWQAFNEVHEKFNKLPKIESSQLRP